jgi:hypothetical protein
MYLRLAGAEAFMAELAERRHQREMVAPGQLALLVPQDPKKPNGEVWGNRRSSPASAAKSPFRPQIAGQDEARRSLANERVAGDAFKETA